MDFDEQFRSIAERLSTEMRIDRHGSTVFSAQGSGYRLELPSKVRSLMQKVFSDLAEVLEQRDPSTDVLFKNPHEEESDKAAWDLLAGESLRSMRIERATRAAEQAGSGFIPLDDIQIWVAVANDVRVILCGDVPTEERVDVLSQGSDPACVVYQLMTGLLAELISVW